jgi:hypothetical protein
MTAFLQKQSEDNIANKATFVLPSSTPGAAEAAPSAVLFRGGKNVAAGETHARLLLGRPGGEV